MNLIVKLIQSMPDEPHGNAAGNSNNKYNTNMNEFSQELTEAIDDCVNQFEKTGQ